MPFSKINEWTNGTSMLTAQRVIPTSAGAAMASDGGGAGRPPRCPGHCTIHLAAKHAPEWPPAEARVISRRRFPPDTAMGEKRSGGGGAGGRFPAALSRDLIPRREKPPFVPFRCLGEELAPRRIEPFICFYAASDRQGATAH
jgi:hypothetical protein